MPDTIEQRIRDAAAEPSTAPNFEELASRGRRQRHIAQAATSFVAAVALVGVGIATWSSTVRTDIPVIGEAPSPSATTTGEALPPGWTDVPVAGARLGVPPGWTVQREHPDDMVCGGLAKTITVVDKAAPPTGADACLLIAPGGPVIVATPLSTLPRPRDYWTDLARLPGTPIMVGGVSGESLTLSSDLKDQPAGGLDAIYRFPDLDLLLAFYYTTEDRRLADAVLTTLAPVGQGRGDGAGRGSIEPSQV